LIAFATVAAARASDTAVQGLDHIPLAVRDHEQARADFEALGFVLKPGRLHDNGLRNSHVKFPNGTEIELLTVQAASDALSSDYLDWLKDGDGPAFLGLYAPSFDALKERLSPQGLSLGRTGEFWTVANAPALRRVFFAGRQHSPTDKPEHFAHPNTAFSLSGVWLAGADAERRLLPLLGGVPTDTPACGRFGSIAAAFSLPEASVVFLPATAQLTRGRSIVGATIMVRNLGAVQRVLSSNHVPFDVPRDCEGRSLWVDPRAAHGMWLEFRQPTPRSAVP
jgi:hypothetical protein